MQTGITAIYEVEDLGSTPARVNRKTGELYINLKKWAELSPEARLFVLLHEAGHVDQDTRSELLADNYAFHAYARAGKPLSKSITALTRLLHFNNPQHFDRVRAQMARAFAYDYHVNGNHAADPDFMKASLFSAYDGSLDNSGYSNFSINPKHRDLLKKMGPTMLTGLPLLGLLHGKKKSGPSPQVQSQPAPVKSAMITKEAPVIETPAPVMQPPAVSHTKTTLYIGGAVLAVVVIVGLIYFLKKRR